MKNPKRIRWVGALTLAPALLAWACGGSDNGVGPTPPSAAPVNVAGSWVGTWRLDIQERPEFGRDLAARDGSVSLVLQQSGSAVSGTVEFTGQLGRRSHCLENASVSGSVAGDQISLTLTNGTRTSEGSLQGRVTGSLLMASYASACVDSVSLALHRE